MLDGTSSDEQVEVGKIHRFLLGSLLNGTFTGNSGSMIGIARNAIRNQLSLSTEFPVERLNTAVARCGRIASFNQNNLGALL